MSKKSKIVTLAEDEMAEIEALEAEVELLPDPELVELQADEQVGASAVGRQKQMRAQETFLDRADRNETEMARARRQGEVSIWLAIREMFPLPHIRVDLLSTASRISAHYGLGGPMHELSRDTVMLKAGLRLGLFKGVHGPGTRDIAAGEPPAS